MIPQERDLLSNLVGRLQQSQPPAKDPEADEMIADLVRERPDAPYVLAQTVLIQDYALHQAQARIVELEQQVQRQPSNQGGSGFLGAIFGSGKPMQSTQPQSALQPGYTQPSAGPWGSAPTVGPAQQVFAQASSQPSFLRSAATTAAGIAGGALLFQGIESLIGGGRGGFGAYGAGYGGFTPQPGLTETTVNNYYDSSAPDSQQADFQQADNSGSVDSADLNDASYDSGGDFGGDGGGDFGTDV